MVPFTSNVSLKGQFLPLLEWREQKKERVYRANPKSKFLLSVINPTFYLGSKQAIYEGKPSFKFTNLPKNPRVCSESLWDLYTTNLLPAHLTMSTQTRNASCII